MWRRRRTEIRGGKYLEKENIYFVEGKKTGEYLPKLSNESLCFFILIGRELSILQFKYALLLFLVGRLSKLLSGFFPLRGGGGTPIPI